MADIDTLHSALIAADAAGDTSGATVLANYIKSLSAPTATDTSAGQAALIGAGRTGDKLYSGIKQGLYGTAGVLSELLPNQMKQGVQDWAVKNLTDLQNTQTQNDQPYAQLQAAHPLATAIGESAPALAIPMGQATIPGRIAAATMGNATLGAMQYGTPQQRAIAGAQGAVSGAVGGGIGEAVNRLIAPAASAVTGPVRSAAQDAADKVGAKLLPSQITQNPTLARVEDYLARMPGSANVMAEFANKNTAALNAKAAGAIGEQSNALTTPVLGDAASRIGETYNTLRDAATMPVVQPVFDAINKAETALQRGLSNAPGKSEGMSALSALKDKLYGTKQLSGAEYQAIASDLTTIARNTDNRTVATALKGVKSAMDELAQGSDSALWKHTNMQNAALETLSKPGVVNEVTGNINPQRLYTVLQSQFGKNMKTGNISGDLFDIANFGKAAPALKAGSPTAERLATGSIPAWALALPNYVAAKGVTSDMGRGYLANGLLGNSEASQMLGLLARAGLLPAGITAANQGVGGLGLQ